MHHLCTRALKGERKEDAKPLYLNSLAHQSAATRNLKRRGQEANGPVNPEENECSQSSADKSGADSKNPVLPHAAHSTLALAERYPALARVVEAWSQLPEHVRESILLLVDTSRPTASAEGDWS